MKLQGIDHIGIIGTGMMAISLAVLTTGHGYSTTVLARSDKRIHESRQAFDAYYGDLVGKGLVTEGQAEICGKYLSYTLDYEGMSDADVIFECVAEDSGVKHQVYRSIGASCPKVKAILSVSSAIVVDELVRGIEKYRDRIMVAHPFNPPHLVPYFELATGAETAEAVVTLSRELLEALDRKPVLLKKSAPGFIGNRLQFALWREALHIVESGIADPRDVDTCLMYSFCPRYTSIGMFEHFDSGGLELNYATCKSIFPDLSNITEPPRAITDRIARGDLGQKAGTGFYDWRAVDMDAYRERVAKPYLAFFNWDLPEE